MTSAWHIAAWFVAAYLIGAVPFGYLVARAKGTDIRKHGSGNAGATNVGRVLGRRWGVLVFLLDAGKGAATTLTATWLVARSQAGAPDGPAAAWGQADLVLLGTSLCCLVGNVAPVFLRFRGGKGVATSLGIILGIYPYLTLPGVVAFVVWAIVVKLSGYVSLGSIVAAAVMPPAFVLFAYVFSWGVWRHYPLLALCILAAVMVLFRHRANIGRLLAGKESKVGRPTTPR